MSRGYRAIDPAQLSQELAGLLYTAPVRSPAVRVAVDGPRCAEPHLVAESLVAPLRTLGRPADTVRADGFWRDASLRLEHGHEDVDAFATWLDSAALCREVLDPLGPGGSGVYLPSLRDPLTNRATREGPRTALPGTVVIVAGELLLGLGLSFDVTIHLAVTPAARARRTDPEVRWTLPALERYDAEVRPAELADIAVRFDDPMHPAIST